MNKSLTALTALIIASFALCASVAKADLIAIDGSISFAGLGTLTDGTSTPTDYLNAIGFSGFTGVTGVGSLPTVNAGATGDYAGLTGDQVTFSGTGLTFGNYNAVIPGALWVGSGSASVTPLWTFTDSGITYSFNASQLSLDTVSKSPGNQSLTLQGYGTAFVTNNLDQNVFVPTVGTWTITDTMSGGGNNVSFSWGSTEASVVSDSGSTGLLIGLGMIGIMVGVVSRRRSPFAA